MATMYAKISLLSFVLPLSVQSGFLKSAGDIMVLEGHDLRIDWNAYNDDERTSPCRWRYASDKSAKLQIFLVYEDGKRHESGDLGSWRFSNHSAPCTGGIWKPAELKNTGIYAMQTTKGSVKKLEDAQTEVKVFKESSLNFVITVNGQENILSRQNGSNIKLGLLKAEEPVNVSVRLNEAFPDTQADVVMTSLVTETTCSSLPECYLTTQASRERIDVQIIVKIKTGIIGADPITISQPVVYSKKMNQAEQMVSGAIAVVFFLLVLIALITMLIMLIKTNRKARKKCNGEGSEKENKKHNILQCSKKKTENIVNDLCSAFRVKKTTKFNEVKNMVDDNEEKIKDMQKYVKARLDDCRSKHDSIKTDINLCQKLKEKENKLIKEWNVHLEFVQNTSERHNDVLKRIQKEFDSSEKSSREENTAEDAFESDRLNEKDNTMMTAKQINHLQEQLDEIRKLECTLMELSEMTECMKDIDAKINKPNSDLLYWLEEVEDDKENPTPQKGNLRWWKQKLGN